MALDISGGLFQQSDVRETPASTSSANAFSFDTDDFTDTLGAISLKNITSGTYTPTVTEIANIEGAMTGQLCQYLRVGSVVTVSGKIGVWITNDATQTQWRMSLPVASTFSAVENCGGTGADEHESQVIAIYADTTNNEALFDYFAASETGTNYKYFSFTYRII